MKRIGYIGLGIMGRPMAENLIKAGFELVVYNRTPAKTEPLIALGAAVASSPAELAGRVDAVCVNVTDTPDVEAVLFGERGVAQAEADKLNGLVVIDHSTIDPDATRRLAARLTELNVALLDAPVSGGDIGARNGTLSVMVGGERGAFDRCAAVLAAVGQTITHCGPSGAGQATKACNQVLVSTALLGVCEALALAQAEGLDLDTTIKVTSGGAAGSWQLAHLGPKIARRDFDPGFMVDLLNKDLNIVAHAAADHELPMAATALVAQLLREAAQHGRGRDGTQALATVIERRGGFEFGHD